MDRRAKYSRMVLNESLIRFLKEKPLSRITVTELCKNADLNRSTYYAHFTDPFDQFAKLKAEMTQGLTDYAAAIDEKNLPADEKQYRILKAILEYVEKRKETFLVLLSMNGDFNVQYDILNILGEKAFYKKEAVSGKNRDDSMTKDYQFTYIANGCFGLFYRWLTQEDGISVDQLAHMMADFSTSILHIFHER